MHILQTRPQGEKSAVNGLARRGVAAISPTETVRVRRSVKGKTEVIDRDIKILPGYIVADPASVHDLDVALGGMRERDARKDVTRVVGFVRPDAVRHILTRHGGVVETSASTSLSVGQLARITAGAFQGFTVRIQALRASKARVNVGPLPADVPIEHLEPVSDPQRHPPTA